VVSFGFPLAAMSGGFYHFNYTIKIQTMQTTLNRIKLHSPCEYGWEKLLNHLNKTQSDDELLELRTILESNGLDDTIWALRAVEGKDKEIRLFSADCAEMVLPIYEKHYPDDKRPRFAIQAARDYANGLITMEELDFAWAAARAAALAAAWAAARAAAWAAAWAAARDAARAAEWAAAWDEIKQLLLKYI
jgi:leucyl aminopeptidase (aminopeptidase T)